MDGSSRKEDNTMPVELAIMRELAYRRKLAALHLRPNTNSTEEVKLSDDGLHPKPMPGPSSRKISSLSGTKRKESPTSSDHHPPLQHQQPFHGSVNHEAKEDDLYCNICQVSCSSPFNLKQHLTGHKHRENMQRGRSNKKPWCCEVCNIWCTSEDLFKLHLQGQKHKAKLQMVEISKQGGEAPKKKKWCELCKLWCTDEFALKQHIEGKKHVLQLHATEKEERERREREKTIQKEE